MEVSLPSSLDFSKALPELPNGTTSTLMSVQSTNGTVFTAGQTIQFDAPARSGLFIDGKSAFIRFKLSVVNGATACTIRRKPAYTPFARLDEFIGSVSVNSIYSYNMVANMLVDLRYNLADVVAQQSAFGLNDAAYADVDGQAIGAGGTTDFFCAVPLLGSFLQECDKLIPTGLMAPIRINLTMDSIANMFVDQTTPANAVTVTSVSVSNPELCFSAIDFGTQVESMIASMSPKLYLKTGGVANASQNLGTAVSGFVTLPFNHRYESIKNLYFLATTSTSAKSPNAWGDSWNVLGGAGVNGTIQAQIGQAVYPQLPINNATGGGASVLQYNRECVGMISDNRLSQCLVSGVFNQYASAAAGTATVTNPAKWICGFPLARINQPNPYSSLALMSGVSAASTPINILLNIGTATVAGSLFSASLVAEYDMLIEIDVMSHQVRVIA